MNFGKRVKRARQLKGYSQKELGNLVGLKQSTISEIESSEEQNTNKVAELAEILGVTTDYYAKTKFKAEKSGTIYATSYCNIHGLWENSTDLVV